MVARAPCRIDNNNIDPNNEALESVSNYDKQIIYGSRIFPKAPVDHPALASLLSSKAGNGRFHTPTLKTWGELNRLKVGENGHILDQKPNQTGIGCRESKNAAILK